MLETSSIVEATSDRLTNTHRVALETEQIGTNILEDLHGQKEQLKRTRDHVSFVAST
jgi:vesicle transport through interaction with t-SNAREs protein 1